jgi:hypothetical protein
VDLIVLGFPSLLNTKIHSSPACLRKKSEIDHKAIVFSRCGSFKKTERPLDKS